MKVFGRSRAATYEPRAIRAANPTKLGEHVAGRPRPPDLGPVVVAVDGRDSGWDALEWAAAEAAGRHSLLRIVHAIQWMPLVWDAFAGVYGQERGLDAEQEDGLVLDEAIRRARGVAPTLRISAQGREASAGAALLRETRPDALLVVDRHRRSFLAGAPSRSAISKVLHRAGCPVAIVELLRAGAGGPSAGRVVVGVEDEEAPMDALQFAFRAAERRGVGVTALSTSLAGPESVWALQTCRAEFPDVDVRRRRFDGTVAAALAAESAGAALAVLGARKQSCFSRMLFKPAARTVLRSVRCPIAIVKA